MREVTLHELKALAKAAYWDLWNGARSLDRDVKLYIHWTAARYNQTFDEYHVNITGDGRVFVSTNDLAEVKSATYRRNTGSIAITPQRDLITSVRTRLQKHKLMQCHRLYAYLPMHWILRLTSIGS